MIKNITSVEGYEQFKQLDIVFRMIKNIHPGDFENVIDT